MKFLLEGTELLTRQITFCNLLNWWRAAPGFRLPYFSSFEWSLSSELHEPCEAGERSNGSGNKNRVLIFSYRRECLRILLFVIYGVPGSMTSVSPSHTESAGSLPLMNSRSFPGASFHYRIAAASQDSGFQNHMEWAARKLGFYFQFYPWLILTLSKFLKSSDLLVSQVNHTCYPYLLVKYLEMFNS